MDTPIKHKKASPIPWEMVCAYGLVIVITYIYMNIIVDNYGDVIEDAPQYDIMGKSKCIVNYDGCDNQMIDGWSISRLFIFMLIGYINPHQHGFMALYTVLVQSWIIANNIPSKHVLNPILTMSGYSLGSAMCQGRS